jgi:hypothetical protein
LLQTNLAHGMSDAELRAS